MKQNYPLIIVALGILLSMAGFLYAGFVGGIPGPDDSPAEAAHVQLRAVLLHHSANRLDGEPEGLPGGDDQVEMLILPLREEDAAHSDDRGDHQE